MSDDDLQRSTRSKVAQSAALQKEQAALLRVARPLPLPKGTKCKKTQTRRPSESSLSSELSSEDESSSPPPETSHPVSNTETDKPPPAEQSDQELVAPGTTAKAAAEATAHVAKEGDSIPEIDPVKEVVK